MHMMTSSMHRQMLVLAKLSHLLSAVLVHIYAQKSYLQSIPYCQESGVEQSSQCTSHAKEFCPIVHYGRVTLQLMNPSLPGIYYCSQYGVGPMADPQPTLHALCLATLMLEVRCRTTITST